MIILLFAVAVGRPVTATFSAQNSPYSGSCPATIKFAGVISGPASQPVTYMFNRTIKGLAWSTTPVSASLNRTGQLSVSDSFAVFPLQAGAGSDELQILPNGVKVKADFNVGCTNPERPIVKKPHIFIAEGTSSAQYPYGYDLRNCPAVNSNSWLKEVPADLKGAYIGEKLYFQEKDKFASAQLVGFQPEIPGGACFQWIITVGHYADESATATAFFATGRHVNGGPMYCITMIAGNRGAGDPGFSATGGPIQSPEACAALPPPPPFTSRLFK